MRQVKFRMFTGAIGLEAYYSKVFLFYVPYLRANGIEPVAIITVKPSNQTLMKLIKRKLKELKVALIDVSNNKILSVYYNRFKLNKRINLQCFNTRLACQINNSKRYLDYIVNRDHKYADAPGSMFDFDVMNAPEVILNFSSEENKFGRKYLDKMQVQKDFVCVHARDSAYYTNITRLDSIRNTPFENFLQACDYLGRNGIYTLRMGSKQLEFNKELFNRNIIDYAGKHTNDFMDIWTIAHCKFFLGNNSGLFYVSYMFNTPCVIVNYPSFLESVPFSIKDIYIPQRLWDKNRKRFLTFKEIADSDIGLDYWPQARYEKEGIECLQTTPEVIHEAAKEMNEVLDGKYEYTEEDNYLQQKFKSLFKVYHAPYHSPARVGREFLQQNKELFL